MIDLTGDGGVVKTILKHAKADAIAPSKDLPLVDGMQFAAYARLNLLSLSVLENSE